MQGGEMIKMEDWRKRDVLEKVVRPMFARWRGKKAIRGRVGN